MALKGLFSRKGDVGHDAERKHVAFGDEKLRLIGQDDSAGRLALLNSFESSGLGWLWATDGQGRLIYLSQTAVEQLAKEPVEIMGRKLSSLFSTDTGEGAEEKPRPLGFLLSARNSFADLPVRVSLDGREAWWSISGKPQLDAAGNFLGYRGSAKDISAEYERQRDAARMVQFDSLTGLANRHWMTKRLSTVLTAYKAAQRSCALMMLDLDRFKLVNDTLGHPAGDELLKQVAQRLTTIVGKQGEIGRMGGDEFKIIIPDIDDRGKLGELAARLIQMISQPYSINGSRAIIGASIGIAIAPYDGLEPDELVGSTDLALYAAKGGGRGQYRFYSSELKEGAKLRRQIEEDLRDALVNEQLELHYQPIVRTSDHHVACFEALVRWNHPERGWINPAMFIDVAEETNLIGALGEWVLLKACSDAQQWPGDLKVAINVSAIQFGQPDFHTIVRRVLERSSLEPRRLELEITESVFMIDPEATHTMFAALKKIGVRLALDDFGTGYSSLGYLRKAPFDKIKIDQSFVRGATEDDNNNSAIISAIVSLARALKVDAVAEGVEAHDELGLVTEIGASHIQGHIFSAALPHEEVLERLAQGRLKFTPSGPAKHRPDRKTVFRRVGVIHEDHRYEAVMRNLSESGARVEGILGVPVGTKLVLDLGDGQLVVSNVLRSEGHSLGMKFETKLIDDGNDGLCTRHRVSPYALAAAGMPLAALPPGHYPLVQGMGSERESKSRPTFMQVDLAHAASRTA
jgi:diguanylate cyclase (GGDEF)-like protein